MIHLNYRDSSPIYEQIKLQLRRMILSGAIREGEQLPSIRDLASGLSINPNTIQRAYRELEAEGYILSLPGKGSFAAGIQNIAPEQVSGLMKKLEENLTELKLTGVKAGEVRKAVDRVFGEKGEEL